MNENHSSSMYILNNPYYYYELSQVRIRMGAEKIESEGMSEMQDPVRLRKEGERRMSEEIRATVPNRGYFLIAEAKAFRCNLGIPHYDCEHWHSTCRRCAIHLIPAHFMDVSAFLRDGNLCQSCYEEYKIWKKSRDKELYEKWKDLPEEEQKEYLEEGFNPWFGFKNQYVKWMKENRIIEMSWSEPLSDKKEG